MLAVGAQPPVSPCRPRPQPVSSKRMDPGRQPQGAGQAPAAFADLLSSDDLQLRVDSFRKLGYSAREAQAVLLKLGLDAETDAVLGELIRTGAGSGPLWEREGRAASPPRVPAPGLVSRGGNLVRCSSGTSASPPPSQEADGDPESLLRPIVIDGSNVAMSHGNKEIFSCQGIQLAVKYFLERGHSDITVFVPSWRKQQPRPDVPIADQHILRELEKKKILVFTPSRRVGGKRVVCYDDRFIVKLAHEVDGIIVSNDTYRDLQGERSEWKRFIEERLLMYSFVNDKFMPPDDPLGRHGPSLDNFLRKKPQVSEQRHQPCPYGKKCTYGMKCKFYHPERANQSQRSLADELRENAKLSTLKESRQPRRGSQPETGHTPNASSLSEELERSLSLDVPPSPAKGQQVSENVPLYWRGSPWSACTGPPHPSSVDSSLELLDSGLGSYDGQHVEAPRSHSGLYGTECPPPQCPSRISRRRCPPPGSQEGYQRCSCCSHVALTAGIQQYGHDANPDFAALCHSGYSAYSGRLYEPVGQAYSLPSSFQTGRVVQDEYWPLQTRSNNSLPNPYQVPGQAVRPHLGAYGDGWAQSHQAAFNVEREEVRKKLQAIFNPDYVDKVMDMFPQLLDPQRLAAKIISLRSYSGIP